MRWLARLQAYLSCQPNQPDQPEGNIVADFTALNAISAKLDADVTTALAAKDATIADLTAKLAAASTADQPVIDAITTSLTATDAKLT